MTLALKMRRSAGASLFVLAMAIAPAAHAQELVNALQSLLGISPDEKDPIEYRERAPLVVPPEVKLRAPEASVEQRNANWPVDATITERKKKAEASQRDFTRNDVTRGKSFDGKPLTPTELYAAGRAARGEAPPVTAAGTPSFRENYIDPNTLRAMRQANAKTDLAPGVEPARRSLTDPPAGLRLPAANAPLVATSEAPEDDPNKPNVREYARKVQGN